MSKRTHDAVTKAPPGLENFGFDQVVAPAAKKQNGGGPYYMQPNEFDPKKLTFGKMKDVDNGSRIPMFYDGKPFLFAQIGALIEVFGPDRYKDEKAGKTADEYGVAIGPRNVTRDPKTDTYHGLTTPAEIAAYDFFHKLDLVIEAHLKEVLPDEKYRRIIRPGEKFTKKKENAKEDQMIRAKLWAAKEEKTPDGALKVLTDFGDADNAEMTLQDVLATAEGSMNIYCVCMPSIFINTMGAVVKVSINRRDCMVKGNPVGTGSSKVILNSVGEQVDYMGVDPTVFLGPRKPRKEVIHDENAPPAKKQKEEAEEPYPGAKEDAALFTQYE